MNKVNLIGRIVKDPEVKTTKNQIDVCSFTLAVDRRRRDANGEKQTDFLPCVAWRKTATIIGQFCHKGSRIAVIGSIEIRSYQADDTGRKAYVTEIIVDEIELLDTKKPDGSATTAAPATETPADPNLEDGSYGFYPAYDDDTHLPFDL